MKTTYITCLSILLSLTMSAQDIFGKWITSDENGAEKSIVTIYEENGKVFGKIIEILDPFDKSATCLNCKGEDYNKPIKGLVIIKDLTQSGVFYRNGSITDPENGKSYKCRLSLEKDNPDILEVRGYIAFMYETQYWKRVK